MEEKKIYLPKQQFITVLIISFLLIILISYLAISNKNLISILTLSYISALLLVIIIFSYLSYKVKIPYMHYIGNRAYASVFQLYLILIVSILTILYLLMLYLFEGNVVSPREIKDFRYVVTFIVVIFILLILFLYLSYKRKIPLLKME